MRVSLFELLKSKEYIDFEAEYQKLLLFDLPYMKDDFLRWEFRENLITYEELLRVIESKSECSSDKFFYYSEFIINATPSKFGLFHQEEPLYLDLARTIKSTLDKVGYQVARSSDDKYIIVQKNPSATAVAEITNDLNVMEYNRFTLKGDVEGKRVILKLLANNFERVEKRIKRSGYTQVVNDLGFIFNSAEIRHDNTQKSRIKDFHSYSDDQLEELYDMAYDLYLTAILLEKSISHSAKISGLKDK